MGAGSLPAMRSKGLRFRSASSAKGGFGFDATMPRKVAGRLRRGPDMPSPRQARRRPFWPRRRQTVTALRLRGAINGGPHAAHRIGAPLPVLAWQSPHAFDTLGQPAGAGSDLPGNFVPTDTADFDVTGTGVGAAVLAERCTHAGAFVTIAHPGWYGLTPDDARRIGAAHTVEIYNHGCVLGADRGSGIAVRDVLLGEERRLSGCAKGDAHFVGPDHFGGWIMVRAEIPLTDRLTGSGWLRAAVQDAAGRCAWSDPLWLSRGRAGADRPRRPALARATLEGGSATGCWPCRSGFA